MTCEHGTLRFDAPVAREMARALGVITAPCGHATGIVWRNRP